MRTLAKLIAGISLVASGCATTIATQKPKPVQIAAVEEAPAEVDQVSFNSNLRSLYVNTLIHGRPIEGDRIDNECGKMRLYHSEHGSFTVVIPKQFKDLAEDDDSGWANKASCTYFRTPGDMALVFKEGFLSVDLNDKGNKLIWEDSLDERIGMNLVSRVIGRLTSYGPAETQNDQTTQGWINELLGSALTRYQNFSEAKVTKTYTRLILEGREEDIEAVREVTGINISNNAVQNAYNSVIGTEETLHRFAEIHELTGVKPGEQVMENFYFNALTIRNSSVKSYEAAFAFSGIEPSERALDIASRVLVGKGEIEELRQLCTKFNYEVDMDMVAKKFPAVVREGILRHCTNGQIAQY